MRVYLDTSVINGLEATDDIHIQEATHRFMQRVKRGEIEAFISGLVLDEIQKIKNPEKRSKLLRRIEEYGLKIVTADVEAL